MSVLDILSLITVISPFVYFILSIFVAFDVEPNKKIEKGKNNYSYTFWPFTNPELFSDVGRSLCKFGRVLIYINILSWIAIYYMKK